MLSDLPVTETIGFVAGVGTTFAAMPDLVAMLKRRSAEGMNPRMATFTGAFQIAWVYYGILIGSGSLVMWNVIAVAMNSFTVGAYVYFRRNPGRRVERG